MLSLSNVKPWPDRRNTEVTAGWTTKRKTPTTASQIHQGCVEGVEACRRVSRAASAISTKVVGEQSGNGQRQIQGRALVGQQRVHREGAESDGADEPDERAVGIAGVGLAETGNEHSEQDRRQDVTIPSARACRLSAASTSP